MLLSVSFLLYCYQLSVIIAVSYNILVKKAVEIQFFEQSGHAGLT